MTRHYDIGTHVLYVDEHAKVHDAIITQWWGPAPGTLIEGYVSPTGEPGCNLVFVSGDAEKKDTYGRQIERETSVIHKTAQPAHGRYWKWPDE